MNYYVYYELDGIEKGVTIEADNPGVAFAETLKKWPEAHLVGASTHGKIGSEAISIHYDPPPKQRAPKTIRTGGRKPRKNAPGIEDLKF